jgi:hypothetical protein
MRVRIFPRGSPTGHMTSFPVKMPTKADIAQLPVANESTLAREHLRGHITSGSHIGDAQWYILVTLRHFRSKGTTSADIAQLPVAHARWHIFSRGSSTRSHGIISGRKAH